MDDGSDVDAAAATSQVRNPLAAVTHAQRQAQASNKLTSAHRSAHMSHRIVPDDKKTQMKKPKLTKKMKMKMKTKTTISMEASTVMQVMLLEKRYNRFPTGMYFKYISADDPIFSPSFLFLMMRYQACAASNP